MATVNLGRLKPVWRGTWAASTAYVKDDMVQYGVNTYICTVAHTSTSSFNTSNFDVVATGASIPSQSGNTGKALFTDGSGLSWGEVTSVVRKQTWWENSSRWNFGTTSHQHVYSIPFTKDENASTTDIWVTVQIPNANDRADSIGWYCGVDTGGSEPSNDGAAHKGVIYIASEGNHKGATLVHKKFTGLSAGSHTINLGWNPRNNSSDAPSTINPNGTSDDNRNHQTSSTALIQEVEIIN